MKESSSNLEEIIVGLSRLQEILEQLAQEVTKTAMYVYGLEKEVEYYAEKIPD